MTRDPGAVPDAARCPSCRAPLPADARFCPGCGRPVVEELSREERRVVTVLFADLEGFTALAEDRDPESVKELLDACFGQLVPIVTAHGGHVDKIIGDELMAVFGAPVAHEDDPERALRAALALGPALALVDPGLRLRVGVNTGEVMAGAVGPSFGYTVTGDVVNTAHRLAAHARPGAVLVGERTRRAAAGSVPFELLGELDLKGKAEPVRAWIAGAGHTTVTTGPGAGATMDLVGRSTELAQLRDQVATAMAGDRSEVITVVGEPGVGKTRLAMELSVLLAAKPATAQVLWVSCPPYGPGGELEPLADLVRSGLGIGVADDRDTQEDRLAAGAAAVAAATGTDVGLLRHRLALLLGLGPTTSRPVEADAGPTRTGVTDQQLGAVRTVLGHLGATRSLLVVVDDVHWAGPSVLRFLAQLPERMTGRPVVVVALARDDLLERRSTLVGAGAGRTTRHLEPLDDDATAELVLALLAQHAPTPVDREAIRMGPLALHRLVDAAGGSPLLAEQLVRYLVERGSLVLVGDRWQWTTDAEGNEASLPDGVRSLIGARLDGLPADERQLLSQAAVFGRRFWRDALTDLDPDIDVDGVLDRLERRGLTETIGDQGSGDRAFRHVLTRDVAYASLPIGERAIRHARVARWLEDRGATTDDTAPVALLAHHYERAVVLARSVDHTDPGLAPAAFSALVRAARDEQRREGLRRADHWYRRARDVGSPDVDALVEAVTEHGQVQLELRDLDGAKATFEELARRTSADTGLEALARAHLGAVARLQGELDTARELFDTAGDMLRRTGDRQGLADALRLHGWAEITAGRPRAALPRLQRALSIEEGLAEAPRLGETLRHLGRCEFLSGQLEAARTHLWRSMAHASDTGDQGAIGWSFGLLGQTLLQGGQAERALEIARNLRVVASRASDPWGEWTCAILEASSLLSLGETAEAVTLAAAAERHFDELEEPWGLALSRVVRARGARVAGDLDEARTVLRQAIASSRDLAHVGEDARLLVELARAELEAGDVDEAERQGRSCLALVRAGVGDDESGVRCLVVLAEAALARGATDTAELLLEEATAPRPPEDRSDGWRHAALTLAGLRLDAGDPERAAELVALASDPPTDERGLRVAATALEERLAEAFRR